MKLLMTPFDPQINVVRRKSTYHHIVFDYWYSCTSELKYSVSGPQQR